MTQADDLLFSTIEMIEPVYSDEPEKPQATETPDDILFAAIIPAKILPVYHDGSYWRSIPILDIDNLVRPPMTTGGTITSVSAGWGYEKIPSVELILEVGNIDRRIVRNSKGKRVEWILDAPPRRGPWVLGRGAAIFYDHPSSHRQRFNRHA